MTTLRVADHVVSRDLTRAVMILDSRSGRYYRLDDGAAEIWQQIVRGISEDDVAQAIGRARQAPIGEMTGDVKAFVESAVNDGLLTRSDDGAESIAAASGFSRIASPPVRIGHTSLSRTEDLSELREHFAVKHYVRLPALLEPSLLDLVATRVDEGTFVDREHHGIGTELCLTPGVATGVLQMLFNDPALLAAVEAITGRRGRCFDGRVYRLSPREGHYDSWHSDMGEDRLVAVSLNLSRQPYKGGDLELRPSDATEATDVVPNHQFGDAVMFRISRDLRHRVNAVEGDASRTVYAGWFRATPDFQDLFFDSLPAIS